MPTTWRIALPILLLRSLSFSDFSGPLTELPSAPLGIQPVTIGRQRAHLIFDAERITVAGKTVISGGIRDVVPWGSDTNRFLVPYSDGRLAALTVTGPDSASIEMGLETLGKLPAPGMKLAPGPKIFAVTAIGDHVYSSGDGKTWAPDEDGFDGPGYIKGIAFDTHGDAFALDMGGRIWKQAQGQGIWKKVHQEQYMLGWALACDHGGRLHASFAEPVLDVPITDGLTKVSGDGGVTWTLDTAGLGKAVVDKFLVDVENTVTAITINGGSVYRSAGGGVYGWHNVDQNLTKSFALFPSDVPAYTGFSGDGTSWLLSCKLGTFLTYDRGVTWTEGPTTGEGAPGAEVLGAAFDPRGRVWAATALGLYTMDVSGTWSPWKRVSFAVHEVTRDTQGFLHSRFSRSEDGGANWVRNPQDEAKFPAVFNPWGPSTWSSTLFNDEGGNPHVALLAYDSISIHEKDSEGKWVKRMQIAKRPDPIMTQTHFFSDGRGGIWFSDFNVVDSGALWKRGYDGSWTRDEAGLDKAEVYGMAADEEGRMLATTKNGIFRHGTAGWGPFPVTFLHAPGPAIAVNADGDALVGDGAKILYMLWKGESTWVPIDMAETVEAIAASGDSFMVRGEKHVFLMTFQKGGDAVRGQGGVRATPSETRLSRGRILIMQESETRVLDLRGRLLPTSGILR